MKDVIAAGVCINVIYCVWLFSSEIWLRTSTADVFYTWNGRGYQISNVSSKHDKHERLSH